MNFYIENFLFQGQMKEKERDETNARVRSLTFSNQLAVVRRCMSLIANLLHGERDCKLTNESSQKKSCNEEGKVKARLQAI